VCSISMQASSLIRSILLVPSRIILILVLNINFVYSRILCYIFIIIFIGGLIVLLVRVSSTVQQEQGIFSRLVIIIIMTVVTIVLIVIMIDWGLGRDSLETPINLVNLISFLKVRSIIRILLLLVICLFILTKLLLDYKGLTRNL